MGYDIITVGSATLDVFIEAPAKVFTKNKERFLSYALGSKTLMKDIHVSTGGGGTNTAVAFARLGLRTGYIGAIGDDLPGKTVLHDLQSEGVHFLGNVKKGKTGYSSILLGKDDRAILAYRGVNNDLLWKDVKLPVEARWMYFSTMQEKSRETALQLASYAKKKDIQIAANISSYEAKRGLRALTPFLHHVDILVLNKDEALALTGKKTVSEMMRRINDVVDGIVVITDGPHTVHAFDGQDSYAHNIGKAKPVNTTGAGDAFAAGFVYARMCGKSVPTALSYGEKEARAVIMGMGAKQNLLRKLPC